MEKYRRVMSHGTEWVMSDDIGEVWPNTWKPRNLHINGLFLTNLLNIWDKKVQRSYVSLYWRSMQTLKEKWLVGS